MLSARLVHSYNDSIDRHLIWDLWEPGIWSCATRRYSVKGVPIRQSQGQVSIRTSSLKPQTLHRKPTPVKQGLLQIWGLVCASTWRCQRLGKECILEYRGIMRDPKCDVIPRSLFKGFCRSWKTKPSSRSWSRRSAAFQSFRSSRPQASPPSVQ